LLEFLKQISLALYNYHEAHGRLPPAYILGPDGKRWHSWRTLILPFLDQPKLYKQYRFDEPWDGEHNRTLWSQVRGLRCLHDRANFEQRGLTHFVAVVGPKTAWPGENATSLKNFWDGSANTIMVVEVNQPVPWFAPMDLEFDDALQHWGDGQESQSRHGGGRLVAFADGSLRWLPSTGEQKISKEIWGAMLTRSGRETVKLP
jgi:prepilin-type processing-associated H-X9-DG protein